ncbi:MFS transporter [Arthrobacter sp. I2-34]|uniref:MFS transporter n=1 Tax=Arthrobacter hankyongi TaxID=2904801 RepID=A0ABS9LAB3_9MICC|nr:MFS transporter [Arthrobacter hankyongi]MCG2623448.1 MFS transporter [Arthrobacter hankyongi]
MTKSAGSGLLAVLTCAMGIGPLINLGIGATSSQVIHDMGITDGQYGLLSTVCFVMAALGSLSLGRLSDRISSRSQLVIIFGGAALTMLMAAVAPGFGWLLGIFALSGLAQAMSNPATNRLTALHAPAGRQEAWIGVKQSGLQASQLFAGLFFPAAALLVGWRGAMGLAAALGAGMLFWAVRRLPAEPFRPSRPVRHSAPSRGPGALAVSGRRRHRSYGPMVWIYALQICLTSIGLTATNVYLPLFAQRGLGYSLVVGGLTTALAGGVGVVSRIFWTRRMAAGAEAGKLMVLLAAGSVASALCLMMSGVLQFGTLLWVGVVLHAGMTMGVNSIIMATVMRMVPPASSGGATGIVSLGMYVGIGLAPFSMGLLVDATGGFTVGWLFLAAVNTVCLLLAGAVWIKQRR